jgi:hypothetical protein
MGSEPSGSGSGPNDAQYLVLVVNADLTNERVFTAGDGIDTVDGGAGGAYTVSVDSTDIIGTNYGLTESGNDIRINAGDGLGFDAGALVVDLSGTSGLEFSSGDLQIADSIAGAGLTISSKVLAVGAGTGIAVNANDVALSHLGIESLSDPGADRIFFWDDGEGGAGWLAAGTGLSISGTTLSCTVTDWTEEEIQDVVGAMVSGNTETYITVTYQDGDGTLDFVLGAHAATHESGGGDEVDHDSLSGFVANEHVDHTSVSITAGNGLTGGGTIASTRTLALTTPGTCTVATSNSASGNHTHAITSSSNPGGAASILATAADGGVQLVRLGIGVDPSNDDSIKVTDGTWIGLGASGEARIEFSDGVTTDGVEFHTCIIYIDETANAFMHRGITINQGAQDDEVMAFKSSDVSHPGTDYTEADTFGNVKKAEGGSGGLAIQGFKDGDGAAGFALALAGRLGEAADTTKGTGAVGVVTLDASVTDGSTGYGAVGTDGNLVVIRNHSTARFIFDAEGSAHADVEWTTFQDHDDRVMLDDLERALVNKHDPRFEAFQRYDRTALEADGLIHYDERDGGTMLNTTRMAMLLVGALRQANERVDVLSAQVEALERELMTRGG